jgi:hypothetical protein
MPVDSLADLFRVGTPLLLLGFLAGALRAASLRTPDPRRRRALSFAWVAVLLVGAPLWLFLAATIGLFPPPGR